MGDSVANYTSRLQQQEREIKLLQDEIERLRDPQELNFMSSQLDDLQEENSRLKYRLNILKRFHRRKEGLAWATPCPPLHSDGNSQSQHGNREAPNCNLLLIG
ncbi:arginine--tRNA ligase, cytoplasmic-like [Sinocyclocheilus grahami]|uniref:arginine--tRNA ligase, cytoplasmic-like n=1 Tax=Sinocyclocheilus grahami TaxID=75366 RepID=UPI0007AD5B52|nr:PREDICTED: arginine--tRNA ligase, cytoplasmic-like [Sinocyclocheilus grahami]